MFKELSPSHENIKCLSVTNNNEKKVFIPCDNLLNNKLIKSNKTPEECKNLIKQKEQSNVQGCHEMNCRQYSENNESYVCCCCCCETGRQISQFEINQKVKHSWSNSNNNNNVPKVLSNIEHIEKYGTKLCEILRFDSTPGSLHESNVNNKNINSIVQSSSTVGDVRDSLLGCPSSSSSSTSTSYCNSCTLRSPNLNSENSSIQSQIMYLKCCDHISCWCTLQGNIESKDSKNDKLCIIDTTTRINDTTKRYITEIRMNLRGGRLSSAHSEYCESQQPDESIHEQLSCVRAVPCKAISRELLNRVNSNHSCEEFINEKIVTVYKNDFAMYSFDNNQDKIQSYGDDDDEGVQPSLSDNQLSFIQPPKCDSINTINSSEKLPNNEGIGDKITRISNHRELVNQKLFDCVEIDSSYNFLGDTKYCEADTQCTTTDNEIQGITLRNQSIMQKPTRQLISTNMENEVVAYDSQNAFTNLSESNTDCILDEISLSNMKQLVHQHPETLSNHEGDIGVSLEGQACQLDEISLMKSIQTSESMSSSDVYPYLGKKSRGTQSDLQETSKIFKDIEIQTSYTSQELKPPSCQLIESSVSLENVDKLPKLPLPTGFQYLTKEFEHRMKGDSTQPRCLGGNSTIPLTNNSTNFTCLTQKTNITTTNSYIPRMLHQSAYSMFDNSSIHSGSSRSRSSIYNNKTKNSFSFWNRHSHSCLQPEANKSVYSIIRQNMKRLVHPKKQLNTPTIDKGMGDSLDGQKRHKFAPQHSGLKSPFELSVCQTYPSCRSEKNTLISHLDQTILKQPNNEVIGVQHNESGYYDRVVFVEGTTTPKSKDLEHNETIEQQSVYLSLSIKKTPNRTCHPDENHLHNQDDKELVKCDSQNSLDTLTESKTCVCSRCHQVRNAVKSRNSEGKKSISYDNVCEVSCHGNNISMDQMKGKCTRSVENIHSEKSTSSVCCSRCEKNPASTSSSSSSSSSSESRHLPSNIKSTHDAEAERCLNKCQTSCKKHTRPRHDDNDVINKGSCSIASDSKAVNSKGRGEKEKQSSEGKYDLTTSQINNLFQMIDQNDKYDILHKWLVEQMAYSLKRNPVSMKSNMSKCTKESLLQCNDCKDYNSSCTCSECQVSRFHDDGDGDRHLYTSKNTSTSTSSSSSESLSSTRMSKRLTTSKQMFPISESNERQRQRGMFVENRVGRAVQSNSLEKYYSSSEERKNQGCISPHQLSNILRSNSENILNINELYNNTKWIYKEIQPQNILTQCRSTVLAIPERGKDSTTTTTTKGRTTFDKSIINRSYSLERIHMDNTNPTNPKCVNIKELGNTPVRTINSLNRHDTYKSVNRKPPVLKLTKQQTSETTVTNNTTPGANISNTCKRLSYTSQNNKLSKKPIPQTLTSTLSNIKLNRPSDNSKDKSSTRLNDVDTRHQEIFELSPYDDLVKSYLNTSDRRIKAIATKNNCEIQISGPFNRPERLSSTNATTGGGAGIIQRGKIKYQCHIYAMNERKLGQCVNFLKETFPNSLLRLTR
uniref:Uncharacterized protein n=1 Tax=Trichobilharzia regenti TaxID=157069 RepID=A0AA85J611_TRIRE|nr:unnamed protein product [Trichobilharzia regenti]